MHLCILCLPLLAVTEGPFGCLGYFKESIVCVRQENLLVLGFTATSGYKGTATIRKVLGGIMMV